MAVSLGAILEGPDTKALEGPVTQVRLNDVFCYTYNSSKHWMGGGGGGLFPGRHNAVQESTR